MTWYVDLIAAGMIGITTTVLVVAHLWDLRRRDTRKGPRAICAECRRPL